MEFITGSEIYWITRLDSINMLFGIVFFIGLIASIMLPIIAGLLYQAHESGQAGYLSKLVKKIAIVTIIVGIISCFIPTTKQVAMIKVLPVIVNNENAQNECKELYNLAKQGLQKLVEDNEEK